MNHQNLKEEKNKRRNITARVIVIAVLVVIGFVVVTGITYGIHGVLALRNLRGAMSSFDSAKEKIAAKDLKESQVYLEAAKGDLTDAQKNLKKIKIVSHIPYIGTQYDASVHLLNAVLQVNTTAVACLSAAQSITESIQNDGQVVSLSTLTGEQKQELLGNLHEVTPTLNGAAQDIELAEIEIEKVPDSGVVRQVAEYANQLRRIIPALQEGISLATSLSEVGPDLAGYKEEKRYLVLFLNNSELRPGGGFIGSYGIMKVKSGEIADFPTQDIYNLDLNYKKETEPPGPIKKYLNPVWFMRDSNWSPDFPTSSTQVLDFYRKESNDSARIDGVIGITPEIIHDILEITGDITVPGYPYTFNSEDFVKTLDYAVEYDFINLGLNDSTRKQILGDLNKTLLNKILTLPQDKWQPLLTMIANQIHKKHIMVYVTEDMADHGIIQPVLYENNWDGHVVPTEGDYLMLVDANFHSLKADPAVVRTINYQVQLTNDHKALAKAIITYKHTGFRDKLTDSYKTYSRILVPKGSKLIKSENLDSEVDTTEEEGKTSFGFYKITEPQATEIIAIEYELPIQIRDYLETGAYKLFVQKQLGAADHLLYVTLQSPRSIKSVEPKEMLFAKGANNQGTFSTILTSDRNFTIHFE